MKGNLKRNIIITLTAIAAVLLLAWSIVSAAGETADKQISNAFDDLKLKLDKLEQDGTGGRDHADAVAEIRNEGISIGQEQFLFYKQNLELVHTLSGIGSPPDEKQMIENLLLDELTAREALKLGITVTEEELDQLVEFQKEAYHQAEPADEKGKLALTLMKNRIRITGLTEEQFWNSDTVRKGYEKALLGSKLLSQLQSQEMVTSREQFESYQQQLLDQVRHQVVYHPSI